MPDQFTDREIVQIHTVDHLVTENCAYRRAITEVLRFQLLDGLHALRNGSPDVTDEFLDRAISTLQTVLTDAPVDPCSCSACTAHRAHTAAITV